MRANDRSTKLKKASVIGGDAGDTLLEVEWGWGSSVDKGEVKVFDERSAGWQTDLLDVVKDCEKIAAQIDSAANAEEAARQAAQKQKQLTEELQTTARRLKVRFS